MTAQPQGPTQEVHVTLALTQEFLSDILVTAFDGSYGGSWHWAAPVVRGTRSAWKVDKDTDTWLSVHITEKFDEDEATQPGDTWKVDHAMLARGIQRLFTPGVLPRRGDIRNAVLEQDAGNIDSDGADVLVQLAVFGELVYG